MESRMTQHDTFIGGAWRHASGSTELEVIDSFTEQPFARYRLSSTDDVSAAVESAKAALTGWSARVPTERAAFIRKIAASLRNHADELTEAISREVGMPRKLAARIQVGAPISAWDMYADLASEFEWESRVGHSLVVEAPVGVVACITPWNYPLHQITGKVAPALLAGCTVVLKPSEIAPTSAFLLASAIEDSGLPAGVFNLVHGSGTDIGEALVTHPDVDTSQLRIELKSTAFAICCWIKTIQDKGQLFLTLYSDRPRFFGTAKGARSPPTRCVPASRRRAMRQEWTSSSGI
jgi:acyl-CoA reductase-like NAD-dependent aldehyde dehydrogenase